MAKKKKFSLNTGKKGKLPATSTTERPTLDGDLGSDDGTFMDDDTEDFLPSSWMEQTQINSKNNAVGEISDFDQHSVVVDSNLPRKALMLNRKVSIISIIENATAEVVSETQEAICLLKNNMGNNTESAIRHTASLPQSSQPTGTSEEPMVRPTAENQSKDAITQENSNTSILQVQMAIPKKPANQLEDLQAQIQTLKCSLNKRDRDVKAAKAQTSTARSELEMEKMQNSRALDELQKKFTCADTKSRQVLESTWSLRYDAIKKKCDEIELDRSALEKECQKVSDDLRKVREMREKLKIDKKELRRNLHLEKIQTADCRQELTISEAERESQLREIDALQTHSWEATHDQKVLERSIKQEKEKYSVLLLQNWNLVTDVSKIQAQLDEALQRLSYHDLIERSHAAIQNRNENAQLERDYDRLRQKCKDSERDCDRLDEKYSNAKRVISNLRDDIEDIESSRKYTNKKLDSTEIKLKVSLSSNSQLKEQLKQKSQRITELEAEKELLAPLVRVGADIRLRNLEQAREAAMNVSSGELDRATIKTGNMAAHRANGTADAVLFKAGLIPDEALGEASQTFKHLYQQLPNVYCSWSPRTRRFIDCLATTKMMKASEGFSDPYELRSRRDEIADQVYGKMDNMSTAAFEEDCEVETLLLELESITEDIVDTERTRSRRRR